MDVLKSIKLQPATIPEAADDFLMYISSDNYGDECLSWEEVEFASTMNRSFGSFCRNSWGLWWDERSGQPMPELVGVMYQLGVTHPDDMTFIIFLMAHTRHNKKPLNLNKYIAQIKEFWYNKGYEAGVWRQNKR